MNFSLSFEIPKSDISIKHGDLLLFLGSCFSTDLAAKGSYHGLNVHSNPFGVVFHPMLLASFILDSIKGNRSERIIQREDLFLSWDASGSLFSTSHEALVDLLQVERSQFVNGVTRAKVLFVTFGTAWGYKLKSTGEWVANCHKFPAAEFDKELAEIAEMQSVWEEVLIQLKTINPELNVVFTVSPVRHVRDGLVENNQSKAILIELVRKLVQNSTSGYFPSYEIVLDELRDYRFYTADRVHPSEEAINYIWTKFVASFCDAETQFICKEMTKLRRLMDHRSLHLGSLEDQRMKNNTAQLMTVFMAKYPKVKW